MRNISSQSRFVFFSTALATFALHIAPAVADPIWSDYAGNAQHTALSTVGSLPLDGIRWQTSVDLDPQFNGNDLLIHYGSPLITAQDTVIVPVKTGATGGFMVEGLNAVNGSVIWSQVTDYILPPHNWTPSYSPALTPSGRLYFAGAGGTIYFRDSPDANVGATGQLAFFGLANYQGNPAAFNSSVFISTPITSDSAGNIYFGYKVTGANPLNLQSGLARISATGVGTFVSASAATSDNGITQAVMNCAPALSADGSTVYAAFSAGSYGRGDLVALNSTTLATTALVQLKDPLTGLSSKLADDGTASPTVAPDGRVYFGVLENPLNSSRGWLLSFAGDLTQQANRKPGPFGWDDTASIVPASMVPSYAGASPYLLMTKDNNYAGLGGDGVNMLTILDPTDTMIDPRTGATVMKIVMSIAGPTPDPEYFPGLPNAVREWCINTAVVDPFTDSVLANSEDGKLYRWNLATDLFSEVITLTSGIGEAYTPTLIGADGTVYAINNATLFAVGLRQNDGAVPEPSTIALLSLGGLALWRSHRRASRS